MSTYPSGCYVYAISCDGVVRYIGKGTGSRMARHFRKAQAAIAIRAVGGKIRTSNLHHRMIKALLDGCTLHGDVLREGMTDADACALERQEIELRDGLWNLREGGEGWTSAEITRLWADPDFRAKMVEAATARWLKPEYRARVAAGLANMSPEAAASRAKGLAAGRAPDVRKRQGETIKRVTNTPEGRARMKAAADARWAKHRSAKWQT